MLENNMNYASYFNQTFFIIFRVAKIIINYFLNLAIQGLKKVCKPCLFKFQTACLFKFQTVLIWAQISLPTFIVTLYVLKIK